MAIIKDGVKTFEGAVIKLREHYWLDGMLEEYATVWDMESHTDKEFKKILKQYQNPLKT